MNNQEVVNRLEEIGEEIQGLIWEVRKILPGSFGERGMGRNRAEGYWVSQLQDALTGQRNVTLAQTVKELQGKSIEDAEAEVEEENENHPIFS